LKSSVTCPFVDYSDQIYYYYVILGNGVLQMSWFLLSSRHLTSRSIRGILAQRATWLCTLGKWQLTRTMSHYSSTASKKVWMVLQQCGTSFWRIFLHFRSWPMLLSSSTSTIHIWHPIGENYRLWLRGTRRLSKSMLSVSFRSLPKSAQL